MKKLRLVLIILAVLIVLGGSGGLYYYFYEDSHFISTENASIKADYVVVTPEVTGTIDSWNVKEGDIVKMGQVLGHLDIHAMISSSAINTQALQNSADPLMSKADIKSPIEGKVVQSSAVQGQVVSPGMTVATVADVANSYISANIEETNIFRVQPGQLVEISIDAYPGKSFTGYVMNIGQATQSAFSMFPTLTTSGDFSKTTQLIPVKISIVNDNNLVLMPGMNSTVKIHVQ